MSQYSGQYDCKVVAIIETPELTEYAKSQGFTSTKPKIIYSIELIFAGYRFYDKVDTFNLAYQMKTDFEKRFSTLRKAEEREQGVEEQ